MEWRRRELKIERRGNLDKPLAVAAGTRCTCVCPVHTYVPAYIDTYIAELYAYMR